MCIVLPTGLRQKHKTPGQVHVLSYRSAIHRSIYIALGTSLAQCRKIVHMYATKLLYT